MDKYQLCQYRLKFMTQVQTDLAKSIQECKHALIISFTFDVKQEVYLLSLSYQGTFPVLARYKQIPQDLNQAVLDLLSQFDIQAKNKELTKKALQNDGNRKVKALTETTSTPKTRTKTKKVRFKKSLL